ncbi:MAG TPA: hypothetical protein DCY89_07035 [Gammaproteobacteria bacterium]|nr:hypothetical protein [Gammaproteobacteria bacterium]
MSPEVATLTSTARTAGFASTRTMTRVVLAALLLTLVLIYVPGLGGPLLLDDRSVLDPVRAAVLQGEAWGLLMSNTGPLGRPVAMLSFIADSTLSAGSDRVAKAVNLGLHLLNTLLVWLLARHLLQRAGLESRWSALWVAGLWALLPLQVSTVLYTVQRMTLLSATFALAGLILLLKAAEARAARSMYALLAGYILCLVLASLAKENGVLLLPLGALLLLFPLAAVAVDHGGRARGIGHALGAVSLLGAVAGLAWFLLGVLPESSSRHLARGWTPLERLVTQAEVLWLYVAQILVPLPRLLPFFHDDWVAVNLNDLRPTAMVAGAGWVVLAILALCLRGPLALAGLGLLFFLLGHALESSILPLELVFEHRNYLPSLGIVLAVATLAVHLPLRASLLTALAILSLTLFASFTFLRVADWADARTFALRSLQLNPDSPRAASQLAALLTAEGEPAAAVAVLERIAHPGARLQALHTTCTAGPQAAIQLYQGLPPAQGLRMDGYASTAAINLSDALHEGHCALPDLDFVDWLATVVTTGHFVHESEREKLSVHVAHGLHDAGRHAEAIDWAETRISGVTAALGRLIAADWRSEQGDCLQARENLRVAAGSLGPKVRRGWESMLADTERLLTERGCLPHAHAATGDLHR